MMDRAVGFNMGEVLLAEWPAGFGVPASLRLPWVGIRSASSGRVALLFEDGQESRGGGIRPKQ